MIIKILLKIKEKVCKTNNVYKHFNFPIKVKSNQDYNISEKIVELPFIHGILNEIGSGKKVLDFGCAKSWLSLSLASMGYNVYGIDLRNYIFEHPLFSFKRVNILEFEEGGFDYIISLSVLEHVGLGVYDDKPDNKLLYNVLDTIYEKLKQDGKFILTIPVGRESVDEFERSFDPEKLEKLLMSHKFRVERKHFFKRFEGKYWKESTLKEIKTVDNSKLVRDIYKNGVNGIGCYLLKKMNKEIKI